MHLKEIDANLLVTLDALLVDASVTLAAERLGRSASAISHGLAKLREIFDDELFVRAGQRLVPTAKAQELAPTVHVILAGMESLLRPNKPFDPTHSVRAFAASAEEPGELVLLQPLRKRLESRAPNIQLDWTPPGGEPSIDVLRSARSHFIIDMSEGGIDAPDARMVKLFDDALVTLARPGHPLMDGTPTASAFARADHIAVQSLPALGAFKTALEREGQSFTITTQVSSALVGVLTVLNSDALLTLPCSLAVILERQFGLARISQPAPRVMIPIRLLWHTSYDRDECHQWIRGELSSIAKEIAASDCGP